MSPTASTSTVYAPSSAAKKVKEPSAFGSVERRAPVQEVRKTVVSGGKEIPAAEREHEKDKRDSGCVSSACYWNSLLTWDDDGALDRPITMLPLGAQQPACQQQSAQKYHAHFYITMI